ncbi:protein of unknown function [Serratia sp. Tan611]|nr:protein of unknown function [Serratia sp. Tan611]
MVCRARNTECESRLEDETGAFVAMPDNQVCRYTQSKVLRIVRKGKGTYCAQMPGSYGE